METNCKVPLPVALNCWKHHAGFIKNQIELLQECKISKEELRKLLLVIGESQMDLYLGILHPKQIANEIIKKAKDIGAINYIGYSSWISEEDKNYKQMIISDESIWTLRLGNDKKRYIHIHPGRYSLQTIRVKAATLKTTIAIKVLISGSEAELPDLNSINELRTLFLKLPPLKSLSLSSGVGKFLNIFNQDVQ
ncbi:MAG: hypothetical protein JSW63_07065 [Ignavibacterium sp.]|nr:MAG: hypothetical protein JSW63_07065 [Ignavibacterium sp.]